MDHQRVWCPHNKHGYILGVIVDIGSEWATVKPFKDSYDDEIIKVPYQSLYPADPGPDKIVDDNCALIFLNEATLLNNLRLRYEKNIIYTYVANILIAINPYFEMKNFYSSQTIKTYQGKSLGALPPHVFAIADKAFRDMRAFKKSQSLIVSGESGAGKTESTKYTLRYLCESPMGTNSGQIEQLILDANPVLEAFGNAKTVRNNNSSRFGKFIEIHFNGKFSVVGGYISHYLLEKSRICGQSSQERNYHIFYQLISGLPNELYDKLKLGNPDKFNYLRKGCTKFFGPCKFGENRLSKDCKQNGNLSDSIVNDSKDFEASDSALENFGIKDRFSIYKVVACVLHLGNICFEERFDDNKGGSQITSSSHDSLQIAANLIGIDPEELKQCLTCRIMQTNKGGTKGTVYLVPLKVYEACNARDALAKALYSRLFDYIVTNIINRNIPFSQSSYYIGVLDIAGFEYFQKNSFEQFCINYCNEKLQQFFNQRILKEEQAIYEHEGLGLKYIEYIDNQDCIKLLEAKSIGIFDLLDEESKLPKPNSSHFTESVHSHNKGHFRLSLPRKSKLKDDRELRDDEGFLIRHFAGAVCYETALFIEKNNDALHNSLQSLISEASNDLIRSLFSDSIINNSLKGTNKLSFISVGNKFRSQLSDLMKKLSSTGSHFIRCIKPNLKMVPHEFEGEHILSQLRCSGMASVLQLMQQGYPSRTSFNDLYNIYKDCLPANLSRLEPRMFCRILFKALGLNNNDYRFGSSKVFFRPGKFAEFDQIMKSDSEHLNSLINKVSKWLIISRWKRAQWCALSVIKLKNKILYRRSKIIFLQKNIRMCIKKRRYRPRYLGILRVKNLRKTLYEMNSLLDKLVPSEKTKFKIKNSEIDNLMTKTINNFKIKSLKQEEIDKQICIINNAVNEQMGALNNKIVEQEKLRKVQEMIEAEEKKKKAEEQERAKEEEIRRQKQMLEQRYQSEVHKKIEVRKKEPESNEEDRKRLEQEKLDHALAVRLASELSNGSNDHSISPPLLSRSPQIIQHQEEMKNNKYDLSKWKYSELRDIINTSCDIELLEACKEEFHRRLKVYHAWKMKNLKYTERSCEERVPDSIIHNANYDVTFNKSNHSSEQRYFRIPFVRPSSATGQRGWWWAHFDGQWIARQMELHPEKPPILLVAGQDDMQMCELSLDETRLTSKRGAEILAQEFDKEWNRNGGASLVYKRVERK